MFQKADLVDTMLHLMISLQMNPVLDNTYLLMPMEGWEVGEYFTQLIWYNYRVSQLMTNEPGF